MKPKPLPDLVDRLIQLKAAEGEAIEKLDTGDQNKCARQREKVIAQILDRGAEGRAAFEALLGHEMPLVRLSGAARVFDWAPELALPVLRELLSWSYNVRTADGRRPAVAGHILTTTEMILAEYHGISVIDVVERELGIPWQGGGRKILVMKPKPLPGT